MTFTWTGHKSPLFGRNHLWVCDQEETVAVKHCGHPTANYPYYVLGVPEERFQTFRHLKTAKAFAEEVISAARGKKETSK